MAGQNSREGRKKKTTTESKLSMNSTNSEYVVTEPTPSDYVFDSAVFFDSVAAIWSPQQHRQHLYLKRFDVTNGSITIYGRLKDTEQVLSFTTKFDVNEANIDLPATFTGPDSWTLDLRDYLNNDFKWDLIRHIRLIQQKKKIMNIEQKIRV